MPELRHIYEGLHTDPLAFEGYSLKDGLLYFRQRLVISPTSTLCQTFLQEFHSSPSGGHAGFLRTFKRAAANLYWRGMRNDVKWFVAQCSICQQIKPSTTSPAGLLQPLPIPAQIWDDIAMDFIVGLPNSAGKTAILVVVDRLSKYAHFCALSSGYTSHKVAAVFATHIVKLHGIPRTIVSDRDPLFLSSFWKELFRLQGTTLAMSSAYHPQTDGQTEVLNRCLEMYLRSFVLDEPRQWVQFLPWAEYWYNTSYHSAAGMTPFQAVYGRAPPTLVQYIPGTTTVEAVDHDLVTRDAILQNLKSNLSRAQARMKHHADKGRLDKQFEVNDWVFVKLKPYRQQSVALRLNQKLGRRYFGPFRIMARIGKVAYKLELPAEARIHPVFHSSLLKKCHGDPQPQAMPIPLTVTEDDAVPTPIAILNFRRLFRQGQWVPQALVQWQHLPLEEATWEDISYLHQLYPNLNLEDKVPLEGDGNDMIQRKENVAEETHRDDEVSNTMGPRRSTRQRTKSVVLHGYYS